MPGTQTALPPERQLPPKGAATMGNGNDSGNNTSITGLSGDLTADEYIDLGPDEDDLGFEELPDGSLMVTLGDRAEMETGDEIEFFDNLAPILPDAIASKLVTDLMRHIDDDKEARKKRDEQYEEGIRRTGLGKDAPGGAQFEGASRVVHPMITEACIDFKSHIMKELFPVSDPLKRKIVGEPTPEKEQRATRVTAHMNWQLTTQMKEARGVIGITLTQCPLGGSAFIRQWWDHRLSRPRWEFCPIDQIYIPYNAANFHSATRRTFEETISAVEFRQRVRQEIYWVKGGEKEIPPAPSQKPDKTKAKEASDKVEGVEDIGTNLDGDRAVYETMSYLEVTEEMVEFLTEEEPGVLYPYLIHIDVGNKKLLGLYRDWEPDDGACEPIEHIFEFPFIPWRGAFSIGFPQLIGGLSGTATGALRALLDSAHANNAFGGLIAKGSGVGGQSIQAQIGEFAEIDIGLEADDIRKKVLPFSPTQPSQVLFQLLGFVVGAGKSVVRSSMDEMPNDTNPNTPVGTQLSRVEQGMTVFSNIHADEHAAFNRLVQGLYRLNRMYLPEVTRVDTQDRELFIKRSDYTKSCEVQPVSDPTIYSDQQRFMQIGAIQQRAAVVPGLYNARKVEERFLCLMKVPDFDELLTDAPQPHELNAVNENLAMSQGRPCVVFPEQDHLSHLQVLLDFMQSPMLGANPILAPKYLPLALQHAAEHMVYFYVSHTVKTVEDAAGSHVAQLMDNDYRLKALFDKLLALASQKVVPDMAGAFQKAMPVLQQAMMALKQLMPPPPVDPGQASLQVAMAETQRQSAADQAGNQIKAAQAQSTAQNQAQQNSLRALQIQTDQQNAQLASDTKLQVADQDNQTAETIAESRIAAGGDPGFSNGESLAE